MQSCPSSLLARVRALACLLPLAALTATGAESAPAAGGADAKPGGEEAVVLNAFEVHSDPDNSYGALESNSITRFRTDLDTLPIDATVFTKTFMDDVAATSVEEMMVQYAGAYGASADPSSTGISAQWGDWNDSSSGGISIGGLQVPVRRDGFLAMSSNTKGPIGSTDSFSTERAELMRGPQSLLYGGAGGGGIVNIVSKQARFNHLGGSVRYMLDQYGTKRAQLDYNVGRKWVAFTFSLLNNERASQRYGIDSNGLGAYGQLAVRLPHNTVVRLWGQDVKTNSRNSARFAFLSSNLTAANLTSLSPAGTVVASSDPRVGHNLRYLLATGQGADLKLGNIPLDLNNIDSFGTRWQSDIIHDSFAGVSVETIVTPWLQTQVAAVADMTNESLIQPGKTLLAPGASANPFPGQFAVQVATNGSMNGLLPARRHAVRFSALVERDFFQRWLTTQTLIGIENFNQRTAVINETYFKADANFLVDTSGNPNTAYGRTTLPTQFFAVQDKIPRYPLSFRPGSEHITVNGVNYALAPLRLPNANLITAQNPLGIVGGSGSYNKGTVNTHSWYLAHTSGFFHDRLHLLGGARGDRQNGWQGGISSTGLKNNFYQRSKLSYNLGLDYTVLPRTNIYVSTSTAFNPDTSTSNPVGEPLLSSVSKGYSLGIRYHTPERGLAATLAYSTTTGANQTQLIDQTWVDAINPAGINGRYTAYTGGVDRWVNVDRRSSGLRLQLDAHPTRGWRATISGMFTRSIVSSKGIFNQVYNDQFNLKNGTVTYADGTPVTVDPAGGNAPKTTPLTLAMLNDPTSKFWANPDADSGRITNSLLISTLTTDTGHGTAATGINGLPITAIQYNWTDPYGHHGILQPVAGNQYSPGPQFALSFINHYDFREGILKGFGLGGGMSAAWRNYAYYYTANASKATAGARVPFELPTPAVFEYSLSYSRQFWHGLRWRTQVNVRNALNHYYYIIVPTASNGAFENARAINSERQVVWTNTVNF